MNPNKEKIINSILVNIHIPLENVTLLNRFLICESRTVRKYLGIGSSSVNICIIKFENFRVYINTLPLHHRFA